MNKVLWPVLGLITMTILTTVQEAMGDQHITAQEWVQVGLQALMAFNVWATANLPGWSWLKTSVAFGIAVLSLLYTTLASGTVDGEAIVNLLITALAAVGVAITRQPMTITREGRTIQPQQRS